MALQVSFLAKNGRDMVSPFHPKADRTKTQMNSELMFRISIFKVRRKTPATPKIQKRSLALAEISNRFYDYITNMQIYYEI